MLEAAIGSEGTARTVVVPVFAFAIWFGWRQVITGAWPALFLDAMPVAHAAFLRDLPKGSNSLTSGESSVLDPRPHHLGAVQAPLKKHGDFVLLALASPAVAIILNDAHWALLKPATAAFFMAT